MQHADKWRERFKIPAHDSPPAEAAQAIKGGGSPSDASLHWYLMNGRIPEHDYIDWAMEQFELPSVTGDFFTAPPDHEFWKSVRSLHAWHAGFFPLSVWEGVITVGCLQPPEVSEDDFHLAQAAKAGFNGRVKFVLASARHLLLLWNQLNPVVQTAAPVPPAAQPGFRKVEKFSKTNAAEPTPEITSSSVAADPASLFDQGVSSAAMDLPEGFLMSSPAAPAAASLEPKLAPFSEPIMFEMPDGITNTDTPLPTKSPEPEAPDGSVVTYNSDLSSVFSHTLLQPDGEASVANEPVRDVSEESRIYDASELSQASNNAAPEPVAERDAHEDEPHPDDDKSSFTLSGMEMRPLDTAQTTDELAALTLLHLLEKFDGAMVLLAESSALRPWKWSQSLNSERARTLPFIDLSTPSIFRIAASTHLPYHGHVTGSPMNTAFAEAFLNGKLPRHATLVPFFTDRELTGMLLGVARQELPYKQMLIEMQNLGDRTSEVLKRLQTAQAA